jgi:large subunit ribosomal protein L19e
MAAKLTLQKRLAADILKVGKSKVWIDPDKEKQKEVQGAITRIDVKRLIKKGVIKAKPNKVKKPKTVGVKKKKRRRKTGRRKGSKHARLPKKRRWINTVRPLRASLKDMREKGEIDNATYRKVYMLIKGGQFRSRSHMRLYMEQHRMLKKKSS